MQHNVWTWQYVFATVLCLCNSSGPPVAQIPRGASNACIFPCICNILTACNTSPLSMDTPHPPYLLVKLMHFWYIARIHYILTPLQSFIMELHHRLQWRWYWTDKMVHRLVQQLAYTAINHTMPHHLTMATISTKQKHSAYTQLIPPPATNNTKCPTSTPAPLTSIFTIIAHPRTLLVREDLASACYASCKPSASQQPGQSP